MTAAREANDEHLGEEEHGPTMSPATLTVSAADSNTVLGFSDTMDAVGERS